MRNDEYQMQYILGSGSVFYAHYCTRSSECLTYYLIHRFTWRFAVTYTTSEMCNVLLLVLTFQTFTLRGTRAACMLCWNFWAACCGYIIICTMHQHRLNYTLSVRFRFPIGRRFYFDVNIDPFISTMNVLTRATTFFLSITGTNIFFFIIFQRK